MGQGIGRFEELRVTGGHPAQGAAPAGLMRDEVHGELDRPPGIEPVTGAGEGQSAGRGRGRASSRDVSSGDKTRLRPVSVSASSTETSGRQMTLRSNGHHPRRGLSERNGGAP